MSEQAIPVLCTSNSLFRRYDLHSLLLGPGFAELDRQFKKIEMEEMPEEMTLDMSDRLLIIKDIEMRAKLA